MAAPTDIETIKRNRRARLGDLLDEFGKVELSRMVDINADYLWQMGKGKGKSRRGISDKNARKIERGVGKPEFWLDDSDLEASVASSATRPDYVTYQQMAAEGGAGPGVKNPDYPEVLREVELAKWQVREKLGHIPSPTRVKLLTVRGNSMTPRIRSGDVVFVDLEDRQPDDGCLFAIVLQGLTLIKRLEFRTDGVHIVSLAAPERPDIVPPSEIESLHIVGRVLGAIQLRKAEDL